MEKNRPKGQNPQSKYRKLQAEKGLARFELQISAASKARFEAMVKQAAEEFDEPFDQKRRMAKARAQIFDEITRGTLHEFSHLKTIIEDLRKEVSALAPSFFIKDPNNQPPLPEAIKTLPDDPAMLKTLLAKIHRELQQTSVLAKRYEDSAKQYEKLYEATRNYNEELKRKLNITEQFEED